MSIVAIIFVYMFLPSMQLYTHSIDDRYLERTLRSKSRRNGTSSKAFDNKIKIQQHEYLPKEIARYSRQLLAGKESLASILGTLTQGPTKKMATARTKFASTKNFKELVIGRCYEYMFQRSIAKTAKWDCGEIWAKLFEAFAYKGPCDVTKEDYEPVLELMEEDVPKDKGLLWSGSREVTHKLSDLKYTKRFTTLEDTLAGFIANKLSWCGTESDPGINFEKCPWECSIQSPYWALANKRFARKLRGVVRIILNGTRQHLDDKNIYPSFMRDRYYLGPYIIPELDKKNIEKVIVVVAHTLNRPELEQCGEKSVLLLMNTLKDKDIPVECRNDPNLIRHMLCVDDPNASGCKFDIT